MGLGFSFKATIPSRRFSGIFAKETNWKAVIESTIIQMAENHGVEFLIPPSGSAGQIAAHYCEEWLDFERGDGVIVLSGRTSTCGPGYHAFMIDVIDQLKKTYKLEFAEDDENLDETDYFSHRNFPDLQQQHANWLKAVASGVLGNARDGADNQMISLPIDAIVPIGSAGKILTPRGPIELKVLKQIEVASNPVLLDLAAGWFPWWDRSPSALDWVRTAKTLMWVDVPWHVPAGENETHLVSAAVKCCKLAKSADPAVDLPANEVRELEFFLTNGSPNSTRPSPEGIGYRRGQCTRYVGSGWSCEVPGYWYEFQDDDNWGLTFGGQEMWVSSYTVERNTDVDKPLELSELKDDETTILKFSIGNLLYRLSKRNDLLKYEGFVYSLQVTRLDGFLIITFAGNDAEWEASIPQIARSVKSPDRSLG